MKDRITHDERGTDAPEPANARPAERSPGTTVAARFKAAVACAFIGITILGALGHSGDTLAWAALVGAVAGASLA